MTDKEYKHLYYIAHKESIQKKTKEYRKAHPDKVRQYKQNERLKQQAYRNEHKEERANKQREENRKSMQAAVNTRKGWSLDDLDILKQLILAGHSYADIASILGRSIKSVNNAKFTYFPELVTAYKKSMLIS